MLIRADWTADDGHWPGISIQQPYRVTAAILAFNCVLCLGLSRWGVQRKGGEKDNNLAEQMLLPVPDGWPRVQ